MQAERMFLFPFCPAGIRNAVHAKIRIPADFFTAKPAVRSVNREGNALSAQLSRAPSAIHCLMAL
jgi:hypothetical protein